MTTKFPECIVCGSRETPQCPGCRRAGFCPPTWFWRVCATCKSPNVYHKRRAGKTIWFCSKCGEQPALEGQP